MTKAEIKDAIRKIDVYSTHKLTIYDFCDGFQFEGKFTRVHGYFTLNYDASAEQKKTVLKLTYESRICSCCDIPTDNITPMLQEISNVKAIADRLCGLSKHQVTEN